MSCKSRAPYKSKKAPPQTIGAAIGKLRRRFPAAMLPEETNRLIRRFQEKGDQKALQLVIEGHALLVFWHCEKLWKEFPAMRQVFYPEDLIQESFVSLHYAVEKYRFDRGAKFASYAIWYLRFRTLRRLFGEEVLIRWPVDEKSRKIRRSISLSLHDPDYMDFLIEKQQQEHPQPEPPEEEILFKMDIIRAMNSLGIPVRDQFVFLYAVPERQRDRTSACARILFEQGITDHVLTRQRLHQIWHKTAKKMTDHSFFKEYP